MGNYQLIIFDCDGTLVNSEAICNQALLDLVNQNTEGHYTLNHALNHWAGNTVSNVLKAVEVEQACELPNDLADRYVEACNKSLKENLKPVVGALDFVSDCSNKFKICVGSNGERRNVIDSLRLCDFSPEYFQEDNIFTRIQVPNGKPAPDLFLFAADKMGVEPSKCLVIEDSPTGAAAGVAAGMDVWGFTGVSHEPENQEKELKNVGTKLVFGSFIHMTEKLGV